MEYKIIIKDAAEDLEKEVNAACKQGWRPFGVLICRERPAAKKNEAGQAQWIQALVRG